MDQLIQLIDGIKLPFELPVLLHPPIVHFAIAIPVIALILEISNLAFKRKCIGVISGLLILLAGFIYIAAFFTGKTDGSETFALLSSAGKEELKEHKLLGIYLVYGIWAVLVFKLIFMAIQKFWAKALFTLILAGFVVASFVQGKHGGEIVYKYGANNEMVSKMDDQIMELEDEIDTLKEKCKEQPAQVAAPAAQKEANEEQKPQSQEQHTTMPAKEQPQAPETNRPAEQKGSITEQNMTSSSATSTIEQKAQEALDQIKSKGAESTTAQTATTPQEQNKTEPAQ